MNDNLDTSPLGTKEFFEGFHAKCFEEICAYKDLLEEQGDLRGLIGPREIPKLWERHILNCASLNVLLPETEGFSLADVGSGAGLPGVVLACMYPQSQIHLIEPMQRRIDWLEEVCQTIKLQNVTIHHGRSDEFFTKLSVDFVTARAVAPLKKLAAWTFPLLPSGGELLALKGSSAATEIEEAKYTLRDLGAKKLADNTYAQVITSQNTTIVHAIKQ